MINEFFQLIIGDYTLRIVAMGAIILGLTSGCLGTFAVLRQQSLLGDAIAHATLPGVGLAFMLTQSKNPLILLLGAGMSGWLGTMIILLITKTTRIKKDTALGMVLSVFFGVGLVFLTIIQKMPTATKAGLDKFLFGNAATLLMDDLKVMAVLAGIAIFTLILFWKEFKLIVFDYDFAKSIGVRIHFLDVLLTTLMVMTIVLGLQTVGVVLMSAMLVAPAAAARQWTDKLSVMVLLASIFGILAGLMGALTSSLIENMPTGPTIVVYLSGIVMFSLLLAPHRGLVFDWIKINRQREQIRTSTMLKNLLLFSEINTDPFHPHDMAALRAVGRGAFNRTMLQLLKKGLVKRHDQNRWALTPEGLKVAKRLTALHEESFDVGLT